MTGQAEKLHGDFVIAMRFGILARGAIVSAAVLGATFLIFGSPTLRARFLPPAGPIAERLAALQYDRVGRPIQSATDALSGVLPQYRVKTTLKGPKSPVNEALKAARFTCSTLYEFGSPDIYVCRNDAAGYTAEGCRLDWLVLIELPRGVGMDRQEPERRRAFVRAHC